MTQEQAAQAAGVTLRTWGNWERSAVLAPGKEAQVREVLGAYLLHELRHHHASLLIGAGSSPRAVADRLGHADPSETLRTYAALWPTDQGRILDAVEAAYGG